METKVISNYRLIHGKTFAFITQLFNPMNMSISVESKTSQNYFYSGKSCDKQQQQWNKTLVIVAGFREANSWKFQPSIGTNFEMKMQYGEKIN